MSETSHAAALRWARESACVHALSDARVVRVTGDDACTWLNGQTTNDIRNVGEDAAVYALSLDAKGRIQADLWVVADGEGRAFVAPASATQALLEAMERYIIMEDVELEPDEGLTVVTVQGPRARAVVEAAGGALRRYATSRLGAGGFDLWVPHEALDTTLEALAREARAQNGGLADDEAYGGAHVLAATPRYGPDFDAKVYPQEAGLKGQAVSFDKGCYLGQEVVCMLENRGKLARRLVQLRGPEGARPGQGEAAHTAEGARVGQLTSVAPGSPSRALAFVKAAHADAGTVLRVGEAEWTVERDVGEAG